MILNPELRKHVWLELSPQRLIVTPLVLLGIIAICWQLDAHTLGVTTRNVFGVIYSACLYLWGARLTADSIVQEIHHRTWDNQRLSSQSPWDLVWGKLIGGNAFVWYICLLSLLVFAMSAHHEQFAPSQILATIFGMTIAGLACHAQVLGLTLLAVQRYRVQFRINLARLTQGGVVIGILFLLMAGSAYELDNPAMDFERILWFSLVWSKQGWIRFNLVLMLAWSLLGAYRLMRVELGIRTGISAWLGFNLFLIVYLVGMEPFKVVDPMEWLAEILIASVLCSSVLVYGMIFLEPKDPIWLSRMREWLANQEWRQIGLAMPCWLISALVALATGLLFLALPLPKVTILTLSNQWQSILDYPPKALIAAGLLFMARDLILILLIHQSQRPARADATAMFYLAVLYGLAPMILGILHGNPLLPLFIPLIDSDPVVMVLAPLLETLAMIWIFWVRVMRLPLPNR